MSVSVYFFQKKKNMQILFIRRLPTWIKFRRRPLLIFVVVTIVLLILTLPLRPPPAPLPPISPELVERIRNSSFTWTEQCSIESTKGDSIVIIVLSSRHHFHERMLIRRTWGSIKKLGSWSIAVLFVIAGLGQKSDPEMDTKLRSEGDNFRDIISKSFVDSYRHLTIKSIVAYEWLVKFCPMAKVVVKTDDDVVINIFRLIEELKANRVMDSSKFFCYLHADRQPIRNPKDFWYVSPEEYPADDYPPFCAGIGYVTTMQVVRKVVKVLPFFKSTLWIEDNFLTGLAPQKYNLLMEAQALKPVVNETARERHEKELSVRQEKIRYLNTARNWFFWPEGSRSDSNKIFRMWLDNELTPRSNETQKIFTDYFLTRIFYLIDHGPYFQKDFLGLWNHIVNNSKFVRRNVTQ